MSHAVQEKEVIVDNLGKKIEEIKQEALAGIKKCESAGYTENDGIRQFWVLAAYFFMWIAIAMGIPGAVVAFVNHTDISNYIN